MEVILVTRGPLRYVSSLSIGKKQLMR
jgi:hypothetical protein